MPTSFSRPSSSASRDGSNRLVSSRCPECGAPVDFRRVPPDQMQVKCGYCGTLITIPGRTMPSPQPPRPPQRPVATITVTSNGKAVKSGWGCASWVVVIIVVAVTGISLLSTTFITSTTRMISGVVENDPSNNSGFNPLSLPNVEQALAPKPRLVTAPYILGGEDKAATQIVAAAYEENGSIFVGFDPVKRIETWRTPMLSEKYYDMGVSSDSARVYIADGATLMAFDRGNGKTLWQTSLANNLQTSCDANKPCLQRVSGQGDSKGDDFIVSLARDGTMQAFAGATGAPVWSRHLNSQPRQFMVNHDQVIVVDTDEDNWAVILVLNATSGELLYQLQPTCDFPNISMRPHASDEYLVTPDGSALLIIGSGSYACVWRYNLTDGSLAWQFTSSDVVGPLPFSWSTATYTFADPFIYFTNDEDSSQQIYVLDTTTQGATPQLLYKIKDYELAVQYTLGDLLVVSAQPSYATDEVELWALDRNTGERRWQRKLGTTHTFDEWVSHPTDKGIFLTVCSWNNDNCQFQVLDIKTGASAGAVQETKTDGNSYNGSGWLGNQGFLTIDGKIYVLDLTTAQIKYTWP